MYRQNVVCSYLETFVGRLTMSNLLNHGDCSSCHCDVLSLVNICLSQALKYLNSIQVINFGDCLVRPSGAVAIAESISEGQPILKVALKEFHLQKG